MILASTQQSVGMGVVVALTAGWIVYLVSSSRRTYDPGGEVIHAPNRKTYLDDDGLETNRLTKYLWWAFATLTISAVGLPVYWLREPFRQKGAGFDRGTQYFADRAIKRGEELFQVAPGNPPTPREPHFGCEACHGVGGVGGVASFTLSDPLKPDALPRPVQWAAPALNTAALRYRPEELTNILIYGRAGTPMPAWGVKGGGPMNDQQISDLVAYITSIALDPKKVQDSNVAQYGTDGQAIFDGFCSRCHTSGFSYGEPGPIGGGAFGPALNAGDTLRQFPAIEKQIDWVAKTAEYGQLYGVRGVSKGVMPHFENMLTAEQIQAVVDYERTL